MRLRSLVPLAFDMARGSPPEIHEGFDDKEHALNQSESSSHSKWRQIFAIVGDAPNIVFVVEHVIVGAGAYKVDDIRRHSTSLETDWAAFRPIFADKLL